MALTDFFRINMPYGIVKNEKGQWAAYNREYLPLGMTDETRPRITDFSANQEHFSTYQGMTEEFLFSLLGKDCVLKRNEYMAINQLFFYKNGDILQTDELDSYFKRLKELSKRKSIVWPNANPTHWNFRDPSRYLKIGKRYFALSHRPNGDGTSTPIALKWQIGTIHNDLPKSLIADIPKYDNFENVPEQIRLIFSFE